MPDQNDRTIIFSAKSGRMVRIELHDESTPGVLTFRVDNNAAASITLQSLQVIIEATGISLRPNYQVSDTIGGRILLTTFGQTLTPIPIRGVILDAMCSDPESATTGSVNTADRIGNFIRWWELNNLTARNTPVQLTIGGAYPVNAFVADLDIVLQSAEERIWRFSMTLLRIPERIQNNNAAAFAAVEGPPSGRPAAT
jgi:hypothetical protein